MTLRQRGEAVDDGGLGEGRHRRVRLQEGDLRMLSEGARLGALKVRRPGVPGSEKDQG
jgi:hypothetical protein